MSEQTNVNEQKSIWVFIEHADGRIADVSLELTGRARELADPLSYEVVGLLCGHDVEELAHDVIRHGADRVLLADHPKLAHYRTLPYARVAIAEARRRQPEIFLVGGTPNGRDFAPRVAAPCAAADRRLHRSPGRRLLPPARGPDVSKPALPDPSGLRREPGRHDRQSEHPPPDGHGSRRRDAHAGG
jgi:hypothetical protein